MELNATRTPLCMYREIFSGTSEQPIDLDIALPDYCPDISKILKCQAVPQVTARSLSGDRLTVEGSTIIRVFYGDEEGVLRCCELSSAFSADFNLKQHPEQPAVFTDIRVDFMNCRAVTRRRVDIHCAFTVTARVWGQQRQELLTGAEGCGVRTRTAELSLCTHAATVQQPLALTEEFAPEPGRPTPETILRFSADGRVTDCKAVAGKLMVKGDIRLQVLYETDAKTGAADTTAYTMPFSQILDIAGLDDGCACTARLEVLSAQVHLKDDESRPVFEGEIRGAVCVIAHRQQTVPVILDAYSTDYDVETPRETAELETAVQQLHRSAEAGGTIPDCMPAAVTDAWCEVRSFSAEVREGMLHWNCRMQASLLIRDENGKADYRETGLELSDSVPWTGDAIRWLPRLTVGELSYRLNGAGALEIRAAAELQASVHTMEKQSLVTEILPDLQHPKAKDPSCILTLYYARAGESLWQIASRCNTTEAALRAENELTGDAVEKDCMLLIPAV